MCKTLFFLFGIFCSSILMSQNQLKSANNTFIKGELLFNKLSDTLIFSTGSTIDSKFYNEPRIEASVINSKFSMVMQAPYPQLYTLSFQSEKDSIASWGGDYFIDSSTTSIAIDYVAGCSKLSGNTNLEYKTKFLPFMIEGEYTCRLSFIEFLRMENIKFDSKLLEYTKKNPDSYVALWTLIHIVSNDGYSVLFETILNSFSNKMKESRLWNLLKEDLDSVRIRIGKVFPALNLKNEQLSDVELELPKSKYTLIDYWFSSCRPCLKGFPVMKQIYKEYKSKGFEIIGISTDRTKRISKWKDTIEEYDINWIHYLDENGIESKSDKIFSFPTTYLLDKNGNVIKKNISIDELEAFLKTNL